MKKITFKQQALNAIKWLDRLRVSRFKQGRGQLGNKDVGFCCIGLGCHMFDIENGEEDNWDRTRAYKEFKDLTGVEYNSPLIRFNDDLKLTFNEISRKGIENPDIIFEDEVAKLVRKHYEH